MERNCSSFSTVLHRGRLIYVEARLQGGAPWGFTLKGGLEHGETLIISKVEEGGKADLLEHPLQVGDQVVNINEVELSGSRQEAISLVKGSYKTLRLTVCRESCLDPCCSEPDAPPSLSPPYSHGHPRESRGCPGGVKLRIKTRRSEPASRPHSWHSTKLGEGQPESSMMQISQGTMGTPWHQTYHSSASTTDLSSYDPGYLRKSPDQYSSRGSMESLDHGHPAYSSCQQLSPSKSSGSIDHLHSKRDSAYSSFSTSSSVPDCPAAAGLPMGKERSYSMDSMLAPQQRGPEGPRQADIRYVRTVYDAQQGISEEHEVSAAGLLRAGESRAHPEAHGGGGHRSGSSGSSSGSGSSGGGNPASNRHSVGPVWGASRQHNSYESLKGAPPPPQRSDSYAAIRNHERPSSWSSLEQARATRSLYKGSWHHSSGSVAGGKPLFATEGQQLHTLEEKSPESSPTTRPRQGLPQAPPTGRLMLPTGIYHVPPPEPHFAQAPASCPNSSSVYPALAKESRGNYPSDRSTGVGRDSPAVENGYQSSTSSSAGQPPCVPQPKSPSQQTDRQQEEPQAGCSLYRPHFKPWAESHSVSHMQAEECGFRRDPYTPVQPRGERQRHLQSPENMERCRQTRSEESMVPAERSGHAETAHSLNNAACPERRSSLGGHRDAGAQNARGNGGSAPPAQLSEHGSRAAPNHHGNPAPLQQEHPLTRLENALAEVQKAAGPERRASQCSSQGGPREEAPPGRVSVLEKVSRFEQQHRQGKLRCQSAGHVDCAPQLSLEPRAKSSKVPPHLRTQSYSAVPEDCGQLPSMERRRSTEHHLPRSSRGADRALQRSKSTFHLAEDDERKDFPWREGLQDILGTIQDTSFNTAYRDSIKGAQSKVLRSTSFRRKDLSVEQHTPSKHLSLERKGPKTLPKPHTPKERHVVTPELDGMAPPALPSVPPVGPPAVRIGGRKRLTLEQKKRCYSEPEKMNEVGVSEGDSCLSPYGKGPDQLHLPETSVANRRRLFELAAHRSAGPGPNPGPGPRPGPGPALASSSSRSDLKQLQQDALAEYMERKTGRRMARSQRPQSAYLQPLSYSSDSQSLSSTSSLVSLQEPELQEASCSSGHHKGSRVSSTLPPGVQGFLYPSGNPARPPSSTESTSSSSSAHKPRGRPQRFFSLEQELDRPALVTHAQPPQGLWFSQHCDTAFERAAPARNSGKSASAEDLLDRSEEIAVPQHFRSRSSPSVEKLNQDVMTGDYRLHTMFSKGPAPSIPTESRPVESAAPSLRVERYLSNLGPTQLKTPVTRREKQRLSERQRAHSMSGLAASVGLPCPFSSPGHPDSRSSDMLCPASLEVLTQSLLPAAGPADSPRAQTRQGPPGAARKSSSDSGTSEETLKDVPREEHGAQAPPALRAARSPSSGGDQKSPPAFHQDPPSAAPHSCWSPGESPVSAPATPLPFLRISESSIHFTSSSSQPLEDEVFLQEPALPPPPPPSSPPPPLPVWEADNAEDFPPPPPPPLLLPPITAEQQDYVEMPQSPRPEHLLSTYAQDHSPVNRGTVSPLHSPPPVTSDLLPTAAVFGLGTEAKTPSPVGVSETEATREAQESLELEYPVLSRRERSAEELRAEALARELVSRDKSLTPILDTWAVQKAMELMEDVFPAIVLPRQRRRSSSRLEDRRQGRVLAAEERPLQREDGPQAEMETDLDEVEVDLDQKKVELVKALSQSVAVLRGEREGLAEEQKRFSALSARVEALVQELCKANEYDKYRMFIGDLEKMVNLLLSLCGQLARVENALTALEGEETEDGAEERETLQNRRRKLCGQHEDARELKENLDRRERLVLDILGGYLTAPQLREYRRFVLVKPALMIRQRHLDELIRQGEEQLHRLGEDLHPEGQAQVASPAPCPSPPPPRSPAVTSL
ncbi:protein Shroom3 isoform X2 [Anguilla anguilla]|uniref:protein Shroom3 isoform X2 n=1 Tax=Anguilla anguilla TaxID=7936 RepID=UPI0015B015B0|nr:protein Shroom3 isoform X2 [Anguilla anguilla]